MCGILLFTINELKEQTLEGRAPTKESVKQTISSKDINLEMACNVPGHYESGMVGKLTFY